MVRRIVRIAGCGILGVVLAVYIGFPLTMSAAAVWPARASVGDPPLGFEKVSLRTADGVDLAAWYAESRNGAAVIVAHGAGGSRRAMAPLARMLADNGYGVLAVDLRGHGESGGRTNRLGWRGTPDIRAAVDYLLARDGMLRVGALGSSMGGEALLGASAECPEVRAIVADGATRRCTKELLALPSERPLVRNFTARVMYAGVALLAQERPPAPLLGEMRRADTRVLLISAGEERLETAFNEHFAGVLGSRAELWVVPGVRHTGAFVSEPVEYERRVLGFLDANLR